MFPNLIVEMKRSRVTQTKVAEVLGITNTAVSNKMKGKTEWTLLEMCKIKQSFFPELTLDDLFLKR